jgi:hypothetical protein
MRAQKADPADVGKVTICHFTHRAQNPYEINSVSANSLHAHEKHGDFAVDPGDPNHCCIDSDCDNGDTCDTTTGTCGAVCLPDGVLCTVSSQCCTGCCFDPAMDMQRVAHCGQQNRPGRCV